MKKRKLYNLIMYGDYDFGSNNEEYIDFPRDRYLEEGREKYTDEDIHQEFKEIEEKETREKLLKLPTLFALEQERVYTRVGKITNIEVNQKYLRIYFKFEDRKNEPRVIIKGLLKELDNTYPNSRERYRTHWAIKKGDLDLFFEERRAHLDGILKQITRNNKNISLIYGLNGSGKTRLSKLFNDTFKPDYTLCYNAYLEDLFTWDNENYTLNIPTDSWVAESLNEYSKNIIDSFQYLTNSKIEPYFNSQNGQISFRHFSGDEKDTQNNIKISKGEEGTFIWVVFYNRLQNAVEMLSDDDIEIDKDIVNLKYIIIDDPVSSLDDAMIIDIALNLINLIKEVREKKPSLKFIITTHHPLFFNIIINSSEIKNDRISYVLFKKDYDFILEKQNKDSPFGYHHVIIKDIRQAIKKKKIEKYHFNLFRTLLEKTKSFLMLKTFNKCFSDEFEDKNLIIKRVHHYSHDKLSDTDSKYLTDTDKDIFEKAFNDFLKKFHWGK